MWHRHTLTPSEGCPRVYKYCGLPRRKNATWNFCASCSRNSKDPGNLFCLGCSMLSRAIRKHVSAKTLLSSSSSLSPSSSSSPWPSSPSSRSPSTLSRKSSSLLDGLNLYRYKCPHTRHNSSTAFLLPTDLDIVNERPHGVGHGRGQGKEVQHQNQKQGQRGTVHMNVNTEKEAERETYRDRDGEREREREKDMTSEEVREARYAGLVNALRLRGRSPPSSSHPDATTNTNTNPHTNTGPNTNTVKGISGRIRLKPILVPPALSGGPYNADDGPSFGPDYHPASAEGVKEDVKGMLSAGEVQVEGSLSQRTVCVLGLEPGTKEDSVRSVFRAFGRIRALSMPAFPSPPPHHPPPTSSSSSSPSLSPHTPRGTEEKEKYKTAYVTYHTSDSVTRALQKYATESVYVRGKEVHLHRHVRGTYLPGENTEGNVLRRLKDLVDAREEESHVNEETEVKVDEDGVAEGDRERERESRRRHDHIPFRILPFPRIGLPRPSSISSPPSAPFVNEPGTLSRILQRPSTPSTPSTPFSSSPPPLPLILPPRSQQHTTSATHTHSKIWDLPPAQAELLVANAVSPFMRSSAEVGPTRHLKIYGAPRRWGVGDMGVWLSEFGTLMRITDGV